MKRKLLFILAVLCLVFSHLQAAHIDKEKALENAKAFFQNKSILKTAKASVRDSFVIANFSSQLNKLRSSSTSTTTTPAFYIFNRVSGGFVIVAADDCVKSILGYSDDGTFSTENMPENIKSWLNFYTNEIQYAIDQGTKSVESTTTTTSSVIVSPLLKNIKWNQGSPYNDSCPKISGAATYTGCVATAMAQIMKYYNWPVTGSSSHAYTPSTISRAISVNFGATNYDWSNMTNNYSSSSSTVQKAAVAQLMYHCGVAVDMKYGTAASSASVYAAGSAFYTYFGYDSDIQAVAKNLYSYSDWKTLIKNELDNKRPVLYSGQSPTDGGHAFVCDGYNSDDLFHINWGWSGTSNGYFELSALNPDVQGIGGSTGGFSSNQVALIGIQKPDGVTNNSSYELGIYGQAPTSSSSSISTSNQFSLTYGLMNYGLVSFSGKIGLALYQNGSFVKLLKYGTVPTIGGGYYYEGLEFSSISLSNVAAGTYQIYAVYQPSGASNWTPVEKTATLSNYLNVTVSGTTASFNVAPYQPTLVLKKALAPVANLYYGKMGTFDVSVTNTGTAEFNSNVAIYIYNSSKKDTLGAGVMDVPVGETKTFQLSGMISLPVGTYNASLVYDSGNNGGTSYTTVGPSTYSPISITINNTPIPVDTVLSATNLILTKTTVAKYDEGTITATVSNTGSYFEGYIAAILTDASVTRFVDYFNSPNFYIIDKGQSITVTFTNSYINFSSGNYAVVIGYYTGDGWKVISAHPSLNIANPTLSVSSNSVNIAAGANSMQNVTVNSNTTWSANSDQNWLTVSPITSVFGNSTLTFTATENTSSSVRTANVTIADNGSTTQTIVVTQAAGSSSVINTKSNGLIIMPNPAMNYFSVAGIENNTDLIVTDISGKLILKQEISPEEKVNVSDWSKGIYLVKTNGKTMKLIVK